MQINDTFRRFHLVYRYRLSLQKAAACRIIHIKYILRSEDDHKLVLSCSCGDYLQVMGSFIFYATVTRNIKRNQDLINDLLILPPILKINTSSREKILENFKHLSAGI